MPNEQDAEVYAVLAGGVGAARFLRGLSAVVEHDELVVIVNVADDLDRLGLRVCPDLDTITYWLAGVVHPTQQWGRADESFAVAGELERLGHDPWFTLGDRDLAVHLHRTQRLRAGAPLSVVTGEIARAFGLRLRLLPASDDRVTTRVHTRDGRDLHFQEYWVREGATPAVAGVHYEGAHDARPAPGVVEALLDADAVLVAPSNPVASIDPVLAIPGIAQALRATSAPVVGVSPIVGGAVVRGMADRLLPAIDVEVSAAGVAAHYAPWLDGWVIDEVDRAALPTIAARGVRCVATDTMMDDPHVAARLARSCLELAAALADAPPEPVE